MELLPLKDNTCGEVQVIVSNAGNILGMVIAA